MNISNELYLRIFRTRSQKDLLGPEQLCSASTSLVVVEPADIARRLNPHAADDHHVAAEFADALNALGRASAHAQGLRMPITSYKRFLDSDHRLYLLATTGPSQHPRHQIVGLLKVGHKKLYLNSASGNLSECYPLCVLDFYVSESSQRRGFGREVFEFMLAQEHVVDPSELAYDRPSPKMVAFLRRHFGLVEGLPQPNNYMVFHRRDSSQDQVGAFIPASRRISDALPRTPESTAPLHSARSPPSLPRLLPATLSNRATSKLPELRRTHSTMSRTSALGAVSSAMSLGDVTRDCLLWPPSSVSSVATHDDQPVAPASEGSSGTCNATTHSGSQESAQQPLARPVPPTQVRHPHVLRDSFGTGCTASALACVDRTTASVATALRSRGAILPHLSVSSVVGRR